MYDEGSDCTETEAVATYKKFIKSLFNRKRLCTHLKRGYQQTEWTFPETVCRKHDCDIITEVSQLRSFGCRSSTQLSFSDQQLCALNLFLCALDKHYTH